MEVRESRLAPHLTVKRSRIHSYPQIQRQGNAGPDTGLGTLPNSGVIDTRHVA